MKNYLALLLSTFILLLSPNAFSSKKMYDANEFCKKPKGVWSFRINLPEPETIDPYDYPLFDIAPMDGMANFMKGGNYIHTVNANELSLITKETGHGEWKRIGPCEFFIKVLNYAQLGQDQSDFGTIKMTNTVDMVPADSRKLMKGSVRFIFFPNPNSAYPGSVSGGETNIIFSKQL